MREAAWPSIRTDLGLTYAQVGLLLSLPIIAGNLLEPLIGVLGDAGKRRTVVLAGGAAFGAALALTSVSGSFMLLLAAFLLFNPASGAFVSLSQASLMDAEPTRRAQNMARWTLAGSIGVVLGPLVLALAATMCFGWRGVFGGLAVLSVIFLAAAWKMPFAVHSADAAGSAIPIAHLARDALRSLRRLSVLRWLALLEFSDLMLDGLHGFLALYVVDVAEASQSQAALAVAVWSGAGLAGHFLMIPLLERVHGLSYLRYSSLAELALLPVFLLAPGLGPKLAVLALMGFANAGWYAVLSAQLYSAMPGRSGSVMAVKSVSGMVGALFPAAIGAAAGLWGLDAAMWLLIAGPVALLIGTKGAPKA